MTNDFKIRHSAALISAIDLMIQTKTIKPGIGKTLQAIAAFWNPSGKIYPSQTTLASMTGNHRRTIVSHIAALTSLRLIKTETQKSRVINGKPIASTLLYRFNTAQLGLLFNAARAVLKKLAIKAAKLAKKDHTVPLQKDHTISANAQVKKITVSQKLADWFLALCQSAPKKQAEHLHGLIQKQAYKAAVYRNQVMRGQAFSREEIKRRALEQERVRPEREKARGIHQRIDVLMQRLREARFAPDKFTDDMRTELLKLTDNGHRLDPISKLFLNRV